MVKTRVQTAVHLLNFHDVHWLSGFDKWRLSYGVIVTNELNLNEVEPAISEKNGETFIMKSLWLSKLSDKLE